MISIKMQQISFLDKGQTVSLLAIFTKINSDKMDFKIEKLINGNVIL